MVANYFTLLHLTKSLSARLEGLTLRDCFSQQRDTLVLHASDGDRTEWIEISCAPSGNYILPRKAYARARKNSIDLFRDLIGDAITSCTMHGRDRQVTLRFASQERIVIQLYGTAANIHWASPSKVIRASFLKPPSGGAPLLLEAENRAIRLPESLEELGLREAAQPLQATLKTAYPQLGPVYVREALYRAGRSADETSGGLSSGDARALLGGLRSVLDELLNKPIARLYERQDEAPLLSLCDLQHLAGIEARTFDSIEGALAVRIGEAYRSKGFHDEKARILAQIDRALHRQEQALAKVEQEASKASRAQQYERFGSLLMANLGGLSKGMPSVEVEDIFDSSQIRVRIPLEQALSPSQNAERYFTKAKKARTAAEDTNRRRAMLEGELREARMLRAAIEAAESREDLTACVAHHRSPLKKLGISSPDAALKGKDERVPFRVFTVAGGFAVWAGKSSENNDLLTMKHARPNDLWFHARGSGGSHVVLKSGTGKGEISRRAIEEAAAIAAYYSKMRKARTVPVAMTQRKYIRKPKGAPAGTVMIERETVLFVEPALPQHLGEGHDHSERNSEGE